MENQLQIFNSAEFGDVRVIMKDGEPRFCLADLCRVLELPQVAKVVQRLDKDVLTTHPLKTAGGVQQMYFVSEDGFYDVILDSRKPEAKRFRKWITCEVLPAIRKTGSYSVEQKSQSTLLKAASEIDPLSIILRNTFAMTRSMSLLQAIDVIGANYKLDLSSLKKLLPPAEHETGYLNPTQIGEKLGGLPARIVNKMLAEAGLQYKDGKSWRLTEAGKAYGEEMPYTRNGHSGYQIRWNESVVDYLSGKAA